VNERKPLPSIYQKKGKNEGVASFMGVSEKSLAGKSEKRANHVRASPLPWPQPDDGRKNAVNRDLETTTGRGDENVRTVSGGRRPSAGQKKRVKGNRRKKRMHIGRKGEKSQTQLKKGVFKKL